LKDPENYFGNLTTMLWWTYQQLRMGNARSRLAVVEKLVASGDAKAVGPLIFALQDKDASIRCASAKALMRFQDRRAVEPLTRMLRDTEPLARAAAAETLGHLGDPVAVNHLVGFLRDADPVVRTIAARSLNRLGWRPGTDSQRVLQILAMGNLPQLAALGSEGVGPLLELLRNGPPNKQFSAVKALGEIDDPRIRPAMVDALQKPSPAVRIAALGILERLAEPSAYPAVEKLLTDTNPSVRGAAIVAAMRCGGARAVPSLIRCLQDESWEVRQATANALGDIGEAMAVDSLCGLVSDPDRDVRESAIAALGQIGDRRAIVPLVPALLDVESSVRSVATAALQKLDRHWEQRPEIRQTMPAITRALKHPDYWVRYNAGRLLEVLQIDPANLPEELAAIVAENPTEEKPPHLALGVLLDMLFDRDRDMRLASAVALGQLRDKSAASILTVAARDADYTVRQAVQESLAALN
jgi:HEAT repeat protein